MMTYSLTHLMNNTNISLNTAAVFKALVKLGYAETVKVEPAKGYEPETCYRLIGDGLKYGKNQVHPDFPTKTYPRFYKETLNDMLAKVVYKITSELNGILRKSS